MEWGKELIDDEGGPFILKDGKKATLLDVVLLALKFPAQAPPENCDKDARWALIKKIKAGATALSTEEKGLCKKWLEMAYPSPVLCGCAWEALNQEEVDESLKKAP